MSETKRKETTLTINFVESDGSISEDENMAKAMELLGAPNFKPEEVSAGWTATAENGESVDFSYTPIMEFIRDNTPGITVTERTKLEYNLGSYANRDFIDNKYFNVSDIELRSNSGSIWCNCIDIRTVGHGVTKSALDRLHKKNVLALKDKIVSMDHVQSVEYTCTLRNVVETECSV
jgi:hypothetical protein